MDPDRQILKNVEARSVMPVLSSTTRPSRACECAECDRGHPEPADVGALSQVGPGGGIVDDLRIGIDFGGTICLAIAGADGIVDSRRSRILGGREWVRLGAVELGLDCLRRRLYGLPVTERIDFERT